MLNRIKPLQMQAKETSPLIRFHEGERTQELYFDLLKEFSPLSYSNNETLDDLPDDSVEALLGLYAAAVVLVEWRGDSRLERLEKTREFLTEFMQNCSDYKVLKLTVSKDPGIKRQQRIERERVKRSLREIQPSLDKRERLLRYLTLFANEAVDLMESVEREIELLKKANNQEPEKPAPPAPMKAFVIEREKIAERVFRPGHSLPTMTIEEYLSKTPVLRNEPEVEQEETEEEERQRLMQRDAFLDEHRRGSGNTYNRS